MNMLRLTSPGRRILFSYGAGFVVLLLGAAGYYRIGKWFDLAREDHIPIDSPTWRDMARYVVGLPFAPPPPYEFDDADRAALARARARIPEIRQGDARLTLLDNAGSPLDEAWRVEYKLARHAFGFGMNDGPHTPFERARHDIHANLTTISSGWNEIEPSGGGDYVFNTAEFALARRWRRAAGFRVMYHAVLWFIYDKKDGYRVERRFPDYLAREANPESQRRIILDHVQKMAGYTRGRYDIVNLWNEPTNAWANYFQWDRDELFGLIDESCRTFREHNPESEILLNFGDAFATRIPFSHHVFLTWAAEHDVPFDRIGLQVYYNGRYPWGEPTKHIRLATAERELARFAAHGKPIDITELAVPARGAPFDGWEWTEARQADFVEALFTVAFAVPQVDSITYWATQDSFILDSGLLDGQRRPRETQHRLKDLIDSWTTSGAANVQPDGSCSWRGYAGEYDVVARRAKSRTALHYRVAIAARQTTVATLRPGKARPRVPEAYDRLGPDVTPESILPGKIALLRPDAAPNESRANEVPARLDTIFPLADEFGLESNDAGETIIRYPHGFLTEPAPAGVNSFQCEIALDPEVQTGPVSLEVFSGEKRFSAGTISHGARVLLSVRPVPGERIAVLTQWVSNGTPQRVVVRRPTFCLGDAELTHGN